MVSPTKITKNIIGYKVLDTSKNVDITEPNPTNIETIKRPKKLNGVTYKIKPPTSDTALYLHITDINIDGKIRPFEVFVSCKDMSHFQWAIALTRLISAVFRKGGDVSFITEELKSVFDPSGGYFLKGTYMNSIIAEIGQCLEDHFYDIGYIKKETLSKEQISFIEEKKERLNITDNNFPDSATVCLRCGVKSVVLMDGCSTCLSCSDSKCG